MKIVQSFWSGNQKEFTNSYGWFSYKYNWMSWILSCHQLVKHHKDVELYTDEFGYEILIKKLQLPYTKVHVVLDELNHYHKDLWAIAKIKTFQLQKEPFLHVDGDVFVWESLTEKFKDSNLVTQNLEITTHYYEVGWDIIYPKLTFIPDELKDYHNNRNNYACNMGIFGGTNLKFIQEFTRKSTEFVDQNKLNFDEINILNFNIFFEQLFFHGFATQKKEKIDFLFNEIPKDNEYKGFGDFDKVPNRTYLHLLGEYKRNATVCKFMEVYIMKYYPESYSKLSQIINDLDKNATEIDFLTTAKVNHLITSYKEELINTKLNIEHFLLKRDLYNEGLTILFDDLLTKKLNFEIILIEGFEKKTHTENNNTVDYLEIKELNCIPRIYPLDKIDKIMLHELDKSINYYEFIIRCKEYFDGEGFQESKEFLILINNRLRKYLVMKIIHVFTF
jgi:hypothetical protein